MRTNIWKNLIWIVVETRRILRHTPVWVLVGFLCFLIYLYKPLIQGDPGNLTLRYGPALQAVHGIADFAYMKVAPDEKLSPWLSPSKATQFSVGIHALPNNPMGTGWLSLPIYYLAGMYGMILSPDNVVPLEGLAAGFMMALAAAALAGLIRPRWGRLAAWLFVLAFAFATPVWSLGSRSLWQECGSTLLLIVAVLCLHPLVPTVISAKRKWFAWFLLWWAFLCQPACALAALWLAVPRLESACSPKKVAGCVVGLAVVIGVWAYINMSAILEPSYWFIVRDIPDVFAQFRPDHFFNAFFALLFSPNRGLLFFALPAFVVLVWACVSVIRQFSASQTVSADEESPVDWWQFRMLVAFFLLLFGSCLFPSWDLRSGFGSAQLMPLAGLALLAGVPLWAKMSKFAPRTMVLGGIVLALGMCVQWLGVAREWVTWNNRYTRTAAGAAWELQNPVMRHVLTEGKSTARILSTDYYFVDSKLEITKEDFRLGRYLGYGFAQMGNDIWVLPTVAGMWMVLPPNLNDGFKMQVRIQTKAFPYNPQPVDIYLNNRPVGRILAITMNHGLGNMPWMTVPAKYIKPGHINTLEFRVRRAIYQTASPSALGVMFEGMNMQPLEQEPAGYEADVETSDSTVASAEKGAQQ